MRARGGCVIQRCQNKTPDSNWTKEANDVMPGSAEDFRDLRKISELSFSVRRRRLTFGARRGLAAGEARGGGGGGGSGRGAGGKVSIERSCITLLMSKNLLTQR